MSCTFVAIGQYRWDIGIGLGGANYIGEVGGRSTSDGFKSVLNLEQTRPTIEGFARFRAMNKLSIRASLAWGRLQNEDKSSADPLVVGRNLSFRNDIVESSAHLQFRVLHDYDIGNNGNYRTSMSAYIFSGLSLLRSNPKAHF